MCYLSNLPFLPSLLRANLCQRDKLAWHKTIVLRPLKLLQYSFFPLGAHCVYCTLYSLKERIEFMNQ